ncbi:fluoride efflux transporter FluC [Leucobacter massiliensis]|uniref:Fluoride-specific ion channel FluC n=1 Tax=Leucobacter massiliensis TaxID=1686285 RepID=A0A2S9QQL2_9MICO|nr:CrcB family protein [Leucobacter massiliensis]PRI11876.1 chromosome condensation protein CrcB [Leucobacter massiliensis]
MSGSGGLWLALGIALAGGAGAALRYLLDTAVPVRVRERFPWGIMLVNLTGSFALGLLAGLALGQPLASVLAVGLLGGYTTFSTAILDTVRLLQQRRIGAALLNGPGMLVATVALAMCGILLGRLWS